MDQEPNTQVSKKWVMIIIGVIVLIIVCFVLAKVLNRNRSNKITNMQNAQIQTKTHNPDIKIKTSTFDVAQLPTGFPSGLPLDKGVKVTKNYTQTASNGVSEAVREYETSQSLSQVAEVFNSYFKSQNWNTTASVDKLSEGYYVAVAHKGGQQIILNLSQNSETKVNKVEIIVSVIAAN